jgi:hypothetical protein
MLDHLYRINVKPSTTARSPVPDLLPHRFLFRYSLPVRYERKLPRSAKRPLGLSADFALPDFGPLDKAAPIGQLRLAWNERGLGISVEVEGKRRPPRCEAYSPDSSDGLRVFIDTRDTQNIHRASRYCHQFGLFPCGVDVGAASSLKKGTVPLQQPPLRQQSNPRQIAIAERDGPTLQRAADGPWAVQIPILRARDEAPRANRDEIRLWAAVSKTGYCLETWLPATCLHGYDPEAQPRLGFYFALRDSELGEQFLSVGNDFPFAIDPSLWSTLELKR